jgi:hypothetical protein
MRLLRTVIFLAAGPWLLGACKPGTRRKAGGPQSLESAAGEAALRYTLEHCPKRGATRVGVLIIGEIDGSVVTPSAEFAKRFEDIKDITFISHESVRAGVLDGRVRRFDAATTEPVLELQISSLTGPGDGVQEAVTAWAFNDDAERKRLELKTKPAGGYEIRELESIPVPHRNDDTGRPAPR